MLNSIRQKRVLMGVGALTGALLGLAGLTLMSQFQNYYHAADYPGSAAVADHRLYRWTPSLYARRDTSYRTFDLFPAVYNWYSGRFQLGPEARAESACITMDRSRPWLFLDQHVVVTICDTGKDRMIFVMRTISFRY